MNNLEKILTGRILVLEIPSKNPKKRKWIEILLHHDDLPSYPLRVPPHGTTSLSEYQSKASLNSRFKFRKCSFNADDIEQGYDPSYEGVEEYHIVETYEKLNEVLIANGVEIENFVDSLASDYPL